MTQGERVKEVRKSLNLTMEQFGNKLGVTKVAISNIEKEKRNLTEQMSRAICREFNVSEEWLKTGEGEMYQKRQRFLWYNFRDSQNLQRTISRIAKGTHGSSREAG